MEQGLGAAHIDVAVLAVVISGLVLLIQLYRWLAGFASKQEVSKVEKDLTAKLSENATADSVAHSRIEAQVKEHRTEATALLGGLSGQIGHVLDVVQENTGKITGLIEWRTFHTAEDAEAHKVINEVRDFMAVAADRDKRVDRATTKYRRRTMLKHDPTRPENGRKK